jgi:PKD repeat protein
MKKLLFSLFMLIALVTTAQINVIVSGHITDEQSDDPVVNHEVFISLYSENDSTSGTTTVLLTDPTGYYNFMESIEGVRGTLQVSTSNCDGTIQSETEQIDANAQNEFVFDFEVSCQSDGCQAAFTYENEDYMTIQFENESEGDDLFYSWNFGDGTYSNDENPLKYYQQAGMYEVTLNIGNNDSTCSSSFSNFIFVGDTTNEDCQAAFTYENQDFLLVQFENESEGDNLFYSWNFGDGTYSNDENPLKYYQVPGMYQVSLSILSGDSSCSSLFSDFIFVGDTIIEDCQASFVYASNPSSYEVSFFDASVGNPTMWAWDFGDGAASYEQNPIHTYAQPGDYLVSLNIQNADSSCFSDYSSSIRVGDTIITDCMAAFSWLPEPNSFDISFFDISMGNPTLWSWDFGDGSFSNEQNPIHTYAQLGQYNVILTIQNADSSCVSTISQEVFVGGQTGCFAWFEAMTDPAGGNTVGFIDRSMGNIEIWFWDFGDGSTSNEYAPVHTYAQAGIYTVCLTISSYDSTCFDMSCQTVSVGESNTCLAQFTYYPDSTQNQTGIQFVDLSYGDLTAWSWSFGDGTSSAEQNPIHIYAQEGSYEVCLTVYGENCQSSWCEPVNVGVIVPDCYNYFTYFNAGNSIQFEGIHSSNIPASYQWDFGDGSTELGNPVTHDYANPGVYYVTLTSWDDNQCTATSGQSVVVGDSISFNQVYGQVFEGTWPINSGFVMIFSLESDPNYYPYFAVTPVDSMGVYVFPFVPNGIFNLIAVPMDNNGYMPTYYESTLFWEEADQIIPGETENPYNINLVSASGNLSPGNGVIQGQINQDGVRDGFIGHIIMYLTNENHQSLSFTEVASDGTYRFDNLSYGTYYVKPELAGVTSDYIRVDLSENQNNMIVNLTFTGNSFLGTIENEALVSAGEIYPNPVTNTASISVNFDKPGSINLMVYDLSGRMVSTVNQDVASGISAIKIPVNQLESGIYFLKVTDNNGKTFSRKIVKE